MDRKKRDTGFAESVPITIATARNPNALRVSSATIRAVGSSPEAIAATTARITNPKISSSTAAPRTVCAALERVMPSARNTDAVIPILVATRDAPMKRRALLDSSPKKIGPSTQVPRMNGTATPILATSNAFTPTVFMLARFDSSPIENSNNAAPKAARNEIVDSAGILVMKSTPA